MINQHSSTAEKIALFQSLFRGRSDVYPRRFQNRKTQKSGYAPACNNEWVRNICQKPRIKCMDCQHRQFIPIGDEVVYWHLQGYDNKGQDFVMGIYPMLLDETCYFLTADFDKATWEDDAVAFLKTCHHYEHYHDTEWGVPVHEDRKHFEMLILEGAQAGLSWETILKRRSGYHTAFKQFDYELVAQMTDDELEALLHNPQIIRNRLKVFSARKNAQVFLSIRQEFGSFNAYVWRFVQGHPQVNTPETLRDVRANSPESDALSRDLKKRGMSFVGSTIMYAYMQAVGLVNDHLKSCSFG